MLSQVQKKIDLEGLTLLFLRIAVGSSMLFGHGLAKIEKFSTLKDTFADPLGVGNAMSLILAISAEVGGSLALILGFKPRLAAIPLAFTMLVAGVVVHQGLPWTQKELPFIYFFLYVAFATVGGGKYSLKP